MEGHSKKILHLGIITIQNKWAFLAWEIMYQKENGGYGYKKQMSICVSQGDYQDKTNK